jgi:hypothetical protein
MMDMPQFHQSYQLLVAQGQRGNRSRAELYIKREQGPISIERTALRVHVPGYFLANSTDLAAAELDERDQLVTPINAGETRELRALPLGSGVWTLTSDPPDPELTFGFGCPDVSAVTEQSGGPFVIQLDTPSNLSIRVGLTHQDSATVWLVSLTLTRAEYAVATYRCPSDPQAARSSLAES